MDNSTLVCILVIAIYTLAGIAFAVHQHHLRHELTEKYEARIIDLIEDLTNKDSHQEGYETGYEAGYQDGLTELSIAEPRTEFEIGKGVAI